MIKIKICPICAIVSLVWLVLSVGVAWGYIAGDNYIVLIAMLMGGSVVGIAFTGEKRCGWAAKHPQLWKMLAVIIGMPIIYFALVNLSKTVVVWEIIVLIIIAYLFFVAPSKRGETSEKVREIEEQMKQCC